MIFIIGGNGFVGSGIARYCASHNLPYEIITRDNYKNYIGKSCDILINANGNSKKYLANTSPIEEFEQSVLTVRKSLEDFRYGKYIQFSTCDVYNDCTNPENNMETAIINVECQSTYGFHKYLAEQCVMHKAKDWLIFRFGGFVGQGLKKNPIFDIINGGPLWLDPESRLQYLNTDVAASVVMEIIDKGYSNEIFNLCGDGLVCLADIIKEWARDIEVKPNSPKVTYNINIEKIKRIVKIPDSTSAVFDFLKSYR